MEKLELHNKMLLISVVLGAVCWVSQGVLSLLNREISTASVDAIVNLLSISSSISIIITIIGVVTGVVSLGTSVAATVLYLIGLIKKVRL